MAAPVESFACPSSGRFVPARYETAVGRAGQGLVAALCVVCAVVLGACGSTRPEDRPPAFRALTLDLRGADGGLEDRIEGFDVVAFVNVDGGGGRDREDGTGGTAILGRLARTEVAGGGFPGRPDEIGTGYTVAAVTWEGRELDVVSVHLHRDYSAVRSDQMRQIVEELEARERPVIILGLLNCVWSAGGPTVRRLERDLLLRPFDPAAKRRQWILASETLEIRSVRQVPKGLEAEIAWRSN